MNKITTLLAALLITVSLFAQGPQKISYQSVVRDTDGKLVGNKEVTLQVSILPDSPDSSAIYTEVHTVTTNANGLLTVEIGGGTTTDDFAAIDWAKGPMFAKTEIDLNGDNNYDITATSELLSVPYSLYTLKSDYANHSGDGEAAQTAIDNTNAKLNAANELVKDLEDALAQNGLGRVKILSGDAAVPQTTEKSLRMVAKPTFTANKFSWDFGDGTTLDTTVAGVNHTYAKPGAYNVTLTASDTTTAFKVTKNEYDFVQIGDEVIEDAEGHKYAGIKLGDQTWLGGDLKTLKAADGSDIPLATNYEEWAAVADTAPIAVWENYDPSTGNLIYNYHAAKIACPAGWHLPEMDEWEALSTFLKDNGYNYDGSSDEKKEAKAVASRVGWKSDSPVEGDVGHNVLANNATGLSLGINLVFADGAWLWLSNRFAWYWTATQKNDTNAKIIFMYYKYSYIHKGLDKPFRFGYNIRCVKD